MLPEEKEGYDAYWHGESQSSNPHTLSNRSWWLVDTWDSGWKQAEDDDYDDDD